MSGVDEADLYDHEIVAIGRAWERLQKTWGHKPNTKANLQEFAKAANDEFLKLGFVVNVMWENNLIIDPSTMKPYPITIEVMGRVPGGSGLGEMVQVEGGGKVELFDHERKRDQVLKSRERGTDYHDKK
jgi:hypothetical protein